jgi:transcriptional regulator with XRE-family HTH domain
MLVAMETPEGTPRDKYQREQDRLLRVVRFLMAQAGISMRQLEARIGVANGARRRVFTGAGVLSVPVLLEMLDALKVDWDEFFLLAYWYGLEPDEKREDIGTRVERTLLRVRQQRPPEPDFESALRPKRFRDSKK